MFKTCSKLIPKLVNNFRFLTSKAGKEMKFLNVAEKNDAAKTIAGLLSRGAARRREGLSVYNKIYEFDTTIRGKNTKMVMTSVSGHLLEISFLLSYKNWKSCDPLQLFDATVRRNCIEDYLPIKKTLEREIKSCQGLIIWTDCDREGESIGFEIIEVCKAIKPNITVQRAKFSEITSAAVRRALENLEQPNKFLKDAVSVRTELDLRTGAAITRLQTMRLQRLFPEKMADKLISYGSCQIPTLGFVVERYKEVEAFVSEPFWKIKVTHTIGDLTVDFNWARNRLFDQESCEDYLMICLSDPKAKVESVTTKPKNKWRPVAMDTVEMEKLGSRKLKLSAKETMTIAEKLYTQGIISYPRTETNMFSKEIDLRKLVEQHVSHSAWGEFAGRVMEWGVNPRNGNKSDQAHPPIHPTKMVTHLTGNEGRVYELIVRHFLACVSKDATGSETVVNINIAGEKFSATGLCIYERNYLDVYVYEKWNAKQIHKYEVGQIFDPTEISMQEGATTAPPLLTEADLIALMEKHGIGTDATHADHINTIKERGYIGEADRGCLVPGVIGMGLYEAYDAMELVLAKPLLRAEFEADLKKICLGQKDPKLVLQDQIQKYKEAYRVIINRITAMDEKIAQRINATPVESNTNEATEIENHFKELFTCPKCKATQMALKKKKTPGWYIGCLNFPECKNAVWLPDELKEISASDRNCARCRAKMLKVKLITAYYRGLFNAPDGWYETCLRCDSSFRETFNINADQVKQVGAIVAADTNQRPSNPTTRVLNPAPADDRAGPSNRNTGTTKNKPKVKGTAVKKKPTQTTIRTFTTSTQSVRSTETDDNFDFFDNDDDFDEILGSAALDEVIQQTPAPVRENVVDQDALLLLDDDWGDMSWGTAGRQTTASPNIPAPKRVRVDSSVPSFSRGSQSYEQSASSSSSRGFQNYENRTSQPTTSDSYQWGSAAARSQQPTTSSQSVKCTGCRSVAQEHVVKKDGANKGRPFYKCPKQPGCNFFQWADEPIVPEVAPKTQKKSNKWEEQSSATTTTTTSEEVLCNCQLPANKLIVRKNGPNNGRWFYGCSDRNKSCGFFKWCETDSESQESESSYASNPSTSAGFSNMPRPNTSARPEVKQRKCGICRQEGHTRSKCPRKSEFEI